MEACKFHIFVAKNFWGNCVWMNMNEIKMCEYIFHLNVYRKTVVTIQFVDTQIFAKLEYGTEKDKFTKFSLEANKQMLWMMHSKVRFNHSAGVVLLTKDLKMGWEQKQTKKLSFKALAPWQFSLVHHISKNCQSKLEIWV